MATDPTLSDVLRALGYTHRATVHPLLGSLGGRQVCDDVGPVWFGSASECWAWLRRTGQIS